MSPLLGLIERGLVPDALTRAGIRSLLRKRLASEAQRAGRDAAAWEAEFARAMSASEVALHVDAANQQHYEVPAEFYEAVLGPHLKYSSCLYERPGATLEDAERAMLGLTLSRAQIRDGERVLELGCGWGSLTLATAARFPNTHVTAVSNSVSQRAFIERRARERGMGNVRIVTADVNRFDPAAVAPEGFGPPYDRVVSVEMFEHVRNWRELLRRAAGWLTPEGTAFLHVFCHRVHAYPFEIDGDADWMARHFFTGGLMPSFDLLQRFDDDLAVVQRWRVDGTHYQRTSEDWLANLDRNRDAALAALRDVHGDDAATWVRRWRVFFMACAELFGYGGGDEWFVGHYLLQKTPGLLRNGRRARDAAEQS